MQIQKKYDHDLISEIAYMCNDLGFKDFPKPEYAQAVFRVQRELAKEYKILERYISLKVEKEDLEGEIILPIYNFLAEHKVLLNKTEQKQSNEINQINQYKIYYNYNNVWVLDYYNRTVGDEIEIYYTVIGDTVNEQQGNIILPDKYYDEVIKKTIVRIANLGLAKFHNNEIEYKYKKLKDLFENNKKDPDLERNDDWETIKIYNGLSE